MEENEINSKCPNCGSQLSYDPKTQKLKCNSCSSLFDIKSLGKGNLDEEEFDYDEMLLELRKNKLEKKVVESLNCKNCGASLMNEDSNSIVCPFCGSSHIIKENIEEEIIPISGIIPFCIDKDECNAEFHRWIKRKFFAPNKFKNAKYKLDLHPVYVPFWTFDMECRTKYSAKRGDHEYVTVRRLNSDGEWVTERERITNWSFRSGTCKNSFDDVMVLASKNQENLYYINEICDFIFNDMERFNPEFLIGYHGEKLSLSLDQGLENAKELIQPEIEATIEHDVGGDECHILSMDTIYSDITFKQVLAPIYNGVYSYNSKKYTFVVNGQTSSFAGSYPISGLKVFFFVTSIVLFVAAIIFFFATL